MHTNKGKSFWAAKIFNMRRRGKTPRKRSRVCWRIHYCDKHVVTGGARTQAVALPSGRSNHWATSPTHLLLIVYALLLYYIKIHVENMEFWEGFLIGTMLFDPRTLREGNKMCSLRTFNVNFYNTNADPLCLSQMMSLFRRIFSIFVGLWAD